MYQQLNYLSLYLRTRMKLFLSDEKGEVNIVAIVVLIGIAVLLAVVFKRQISGLLGDLFGTIKTTATNAITTAPAKSGPY